MRRILWFGVQSHACKLGILILLGDYCKTGVGAVMVQVTEAEGLCASGRSRGKLILLESCGANFDFVP